MAVAVESGQAFTPETPRVVFEGTYVWVANRRTWDIAPDGQRFLMLKEGSGQGNAAGNIIVVQTLVRRSETPGAYALTGGPLSLSGVHAL